MESYVLRVKPAMDAFLRTPSKERIDQLHRELLQFDWMQMKIFNVQILVPLVLKLEELTEYSQELRTGTINCIRLVTSKIYLRDVKALHTMLIIVLKQIRDGKTASTKPNLSEEIKLAVVECIAECLRRSTTDVLEVFYTKDASVLLGQILLTIVDIIEKEKYRKLILISLQCLMVVFYVHDDADIVDVVLRRQVADTLFIYLPKIVTILFKTSLSDEKIGESLKTTAIQSLGRILCVIYEETNEAVIRINYGASDFKILFENTLKFDGNVETDADVLGSNNSKEHLQASLKRIQTNGRSPQWFRATGRKLRIIFKKTSILRSHQSVSIRREYAQMCCILMDHCALNLRDNFIFLLENIVALSEDVNESVRCPCIKQLRKLQNDQCKERLFDENADLLFDDHINRLPRIIKRCDDGEQYAELMFLQGFMRNLSSSKLQILLMIPKNMEIFCMCLLAAVEMNVSHDLLVEDHSLRHIGDFDFEGCCKLHWRQYKNLSEPRCIEAVQEICSILGRTNILNCALFDFLLELLMQQNEKMNEIIIVMLWMATLCKNTTNDNKRAENLTAMLLEEILDDKHWHLALQPDQMWQLKVEKPTYWYADRTPGLYESAIEIRTQDCDSDDDDDGDGNASRYRVTIADAQYNVQHTCMILDALGHCAMFLGTRFDKYIFRCLHKVLLKVANSNSMVYKAATFCLISMQKALHFAKTSHFIETYADYITYHLNTILKRSPESQSAVDILTVVLQHSTHKALPHLENIFQSIRDECTKNYQSDNINSYLKVFNAFLRNVRCWQTESINDLNDDISMQVDSEQNIDDILSTWLDALQRPSAMEEDDINFDMHNETQEHNDTTAQNTEEEPDDTTEKIPLPSHIEMTKEILNQVLKLISSANQIHQILALECLISGLPLLKDYEDELLPLVHLVWQPLMEKFHQKDAIVLNRCFTLLNILATYAKDFILKRSLDDVIPFLKRFLRSAAEHSAEEAINAQTQEYKLQLKLLKEFSNLIQCMQIDGKHLNDIIEEISLYLSKKQPAELQEYAVQFYNSLRCYNGPLIYVTVLRKAHLRDFEENVSKILKEFEIK